MPGGSPATRKVIGQAAADASKKRVVPIIHQPRQPIDNLLKGLGVGDVNEAALSLAFLFFSVPTLLFPLSGDETLAC